MHCKVIHSDELLTLETLIEEFMVDRSKNEKTFEELIKIFERSCIEMTPLKDFSNDFRILYFESVMEKREWDDYIIFSADEKMKVIDGIHRGVAYLRCIGKGIKEINLPKLLVVYD